MKKILAHWNSRRGIEGEDILRFSHWTIDNGKTTHPAVYTPPSTQTVPPVVIEGGSRRSRRQPAKAKPKKGKKKDRKGKGRARESDQEESSDGERISFSGIPQGTEDEDDDAGEDHQQPTKSGENSGSSGSPPAETPIDPFSPAAVENTREAKVAFFKEIIKFGSFPLLIEYYKSLPVRSTFFSDPSVKILMN